MPTDFAPRFERAPLAWAIWYLEQHPELYRKFRDLADDYLAKKPRGLLSADMILHVIRYNAGGVDGDTFRLNNNLTPLYARLYQIERPNAPVKTRKSWLDELSDTDMARLMFAFQPLRDGRLL